MTLKEYKAKAKQDPEWAPGWLAVDSALEKLYPAQEPSHFGAILPARLGGDMYLDGASIYRSVFGYYHVVSYGMSALYADPESYGGEWSKWGYEMTMKIVADSVEECKFAISVMNNLARYTCTSKRFFEPYQFIAGESSINTGRDSQITSMLCVPDTELSGMDTLHGRLDFIQLVGITTAELEYLKANHSKAQQLSTQLMRHYPHLETDLNRTQNHCVSCNNTDK